MSALKMERVDNTIVPSRYNARENPRSDRGANGQSTPFPFYRWQIMYSEITTERQARDERRGFKRRELSFGQFGQISDVQNAVLRTIELEKNPVN